MKTRFMTLALILLATSSTLSGCIIAPDGGRGRHDARDHRDDDRRDDDRRDDRGRRCDHDDREHDERCHDR